MSKMPDFAELRANLLKLIPEITNDKSKFIEYGDVNMQHALRSIIRIRNINTPAGMQFCIKSMHLGMEGSGDYVGTDTEVLIGRFLERIAYYHRPLKLRMPEALAKKMNKPFDEGPKYGIYISDDQTSINMSLHAALSRSKTSK